jgi:CheY-like chemotaxis protein
MSKSILVVDDNDDVRELLLHILRNQHHQATGAANGEEALVALESQHFDLAFLDVMMPGISGIDLLLQIRNSQKNYQSLPIAMITALSAPEEIERATTAGATTYLIKPFRSGDIHAVLHKIFPPQEIGERK